MQVTTELQQNFQTYGGSDNTNPSGLSASKSLTYAEGSSWQKANIEKVSVCPFTFNFSGEVGLFGSENTFVRIDMNIIDAGGGVLVVNDYIAADVQTSTPITINTFESAIVNTSIDTQPFNEFEPADIEADFVNNLESIVKVELLNELAGNQYQNKWVDVCLYDKYRNEIGIGLASETIPERSAFENTSEGNSAYQTALTAYTQAPYTYTFYAFASDSFYVGVHARNTKRLPYKFQVKISNLTEVNELTDKERKLLASYI